MQKVLVTGASGLLGFHTAWKYAESAEVIGTVFQHPLQYVPFQTIPVDLSHPGKGRQLVVDIAPDLIIHTAAIANVDQCEREPELAEQMNAMLPGELAIAALDVGAKLVHISTDAVFDGERGNYVEEDEPNPLGVYAHTKLMGEELVIETNPDAIVARVNFFGWSISGTRSLAEWFFNQLSAEMPVFGFHDVIFNPLAVNLLVETLMEMVYADLNGIFHVVSSETLSKYEFGLRLARKFGLEERLITPKSWKDGGLTARRSPRLNLNTSKLQDALGHSLPSVDEGITQFYQEYRDGWPQRLQARVSDDPLD